MALFSRIFGIEKIAVKDSCRKLLLELIEGFVRVVARGLHLDGTNLVLARKQEIDFVRTTRLGFFERVIKELVPGTSEQLGDGIFVDIPQIGAELIGKQLPIDLVLRFFGIRCVISDKPFYLVE